MTKTTEDAYLCCSISKTGNKQAKLAYCSQIRPNIAFPKIISTLGSLIYAISCF